MMLYGADLARDPLCLLCCVAVYVTASTKRHEYEAMVFDGHNSQVAYATRASLGLDIDMYVRVLPIERQLSDHPILIWITILARSEISRHA